MMPMHVDFPSDHPVEEVGRHLLAVLLKHQGLTEMAVNMVMQEIENPGNLERLPSPLEESIRAVQQTKWKLIRSRQEQVKSYKEVCAPVLERCRFLMNEIKPAISAQVKAMKSNRILYKESKFRETVKSV